MTITELIKQLEEIKSAHGDLKLYTNNECFSVINTEKYSSMNSKNRGYKSIVWKNDNN